MSELFSDNEQKVLRILGRRKMTIAELTEKFYSGGRRPLDANNKVASTVRRINEKVEYHGVPWFLNGVGRGRAGRTVWRDKRPRSSSEEV